MNDTSGPVFVFEAKPPWHVVVYPTLVDAAESVESLDVGDDDEAFTVTGQVVRLTATPELFADLEVTDRIDTERLSLLLRRAPGPAHLEEYPAEYAQAWLDEGSADAGRSGFRRILGRLGRILTSESSRASATPAGEPCPCCGYRTLRERMAYEPCPVCFWEDDPNQMRDPDSADGANGLSLVEAQGSYRRLGAIHQKFRAKVRRPRPGEQRDRDWQPNTEEGSRPAKPATRAGVSLLSDLAPHSGWYAVRCIFESSWPDPEPSDPAKHRYEERITCGAHRRSTKRSRSPKPKPMSTRRQPRSDTIAISAWRRHSTCSMCRSTAARSTR